VKCLVKKQLLERNPLPRQIRVSVGSAIILGLLEGKLDAEPTTAYLMTFKTGKCIANCGFCPQARNSKSNAELLSRVTWPSFSTRSVFGLIASAAQSGKIRRVCIQALNYSKVFSELYALVKTLKQQVKVPISVSCQPLNIGNMQLLADAGVDRIGIAVDAATEKLFDAVKGSGAGGPYKWQDQFRLLREATDFFGKGNVSTHLIIGLGETEKEAVSLVHECGVMGVLPALFAFTPVRGTTLATTPQPNIDSYRRIQVARYLITNAIANANDMKFDVDGSIVDFGISKETLLSVVKNGNPFRTSGCPNCNRPFYNEKPSGPLYNYPRKLIVEEISAIKRQFELNCP